MKSNLTDHLRRKVMATDLIAPGVEDREAIIQILLTDVVSMSAAQLVDLGILPPDSRVELMVSRQDKELRNRLMKIEGFQKFYDELLEEILMIRYEMLIEISLRILPEWSEPETRWSVTAHQPVRRAKIG